MELLITFGHTLMLTVKDVLPVLALLMFFQLVVLRRPIPNWKRVVAGFVFVLVGLTLFLDGLETALFPIGKIMAKQLSSPEFVFGAKTAPAGVTWHAYGWVYVFGILIGFATTVAEPALIAVCYKAHEVSRGSLSQWGLRLAVATGVAMGIGIGTFRIVTGTPLYIYIIAGYLIVVIQTIFAPREIIALAYDSGGGHHIDGDRAPGCGPGPGSVGNDSGPRSRTGWIRIDRLCKCLSHNDGDGVCSVGTLAGTAESKGG